MRIVVVRDAEDVETGRGDRCSCDVLWGMSGRESGRGIWRVSEDCDDGGVSVLDSCLGECMCMCVCGVWGCVVKDSVWIECGECVCECVSVGD